MPLLPELTSRRAVRTALVYGVVGVAVVVAAVVIGAALGGDAGSPDLVDPSAPAEAERPDRSSIAVLPFVDRSAEGDAQYLGDGAAEELLNALARVPGLRVAARTSAFSFHGETDVREVGRELSVATVVEGSVRREGDSVRVTAQLVDARTGESIFTDDYRDELHGLRAVQEQIASSIAEELELPLRDSLGPAHAAPRTSDPEAYDHYLRGLDLLRRRDVAGAATSLRRALERDSTFAAAWAQLARAEALKPYAGAGTWSTALAGAARAARRALDLDSTSASAFTALANVHRDRWEWELAEAAYWRALSLSPESPDLLDQYGQHLVQLGRYDEAVDELERAREIDPLAAAHSTALGWAYFLYRRFEEAEQAWRDAIALDPELPRPREGLFLLLHATGRTDGIEAEAALFRGLPPYVAWQRRDLGAAEIERIRALFRRTRGTAEATQALEALVVSGRQDAFFDLLGDWARQRAGPIQFLWLPQLDGWRADDPRFPPIRDRLRLPDDAATEGTSRDPEGGLP